MHLHPTVSETSGNTAIELHFKSVLKSGSWAFVTVCLMSLEGFSSNVLCSSHVVSDLQRNSLTLLFLGQRTKENDP